MDIDIETTETGTSKGASAVAAMRKWRLVGVEVLPGETAGEAISRRWPGALVKKGRIVVRSDEASEVVEHEVDTESETALEPDPYWSELGDRGEGARLLFAAGLKRKAFRYADCETRAEKAACSSLPDEHRFYKKYHCMNRFCKYCGSVHRARLHGHYEPLLVAALRDRDHPSGYTLARLNFTLRCDGELPTSDQVQAFNQAVRRTVRRSVRKILELRAANGEDRAASALKSRKATYGILFCDECGFETRGHIPDARRVAHGLNLHAHGLFYGPFLSDWGKGWEIFRDIWRKETKRAFGEESHGCYVTHLRGWRSNPVPAVKRGLNHLLKYVSKCPYETLQRMAELERCFDGARRVHAGGVWYGLKEPEHSHGSGYCPICEREGHKSPLYLSRRLLPNGGEIPEYWPVKTLEADGWRDIEVVRRERGLSPNDSDGGGP